ncbi:hypothetical protein MKW92_035224 [Papaver armeniacum]|nr:hypothetical protein MKW92_035224 [Papaver armeniacum]
MAKISASSFLGFFLVLAVLFAIQMAMTAEAQPTGCTGDTVIIGGTCDQCEARCSDAYNAQILVGYLCVPVSGTVQCGCCIKS